MLPATQAACLRNAARRAAAQTAALCQARRIHNKSHGLFNAEAAPVARDARLDKGQRTSAVDDILARRAKAGKLVAGIAAASDSDMFKGSVSRSPMPLLGEPDADCSTARGKAQGQALGLYVIWALTPCPRRRR